MIGNLTGLTNKAAGKQGRNSHRYIKTCTNFRKEELLTPEKQQQKQDV